MRSLVATCLTLLFLAPMAFAEIVIGVLAPQGEEQAYARWQPLFDQLGEDLDTDIQIFAVGATAGTDYFLAGDIDYLLGNPVQTAVVVDTMNAVPVVSVAKKSGNRFAGLIVVAADSPIKTLEDLEGRRIGTLTDWAAGGYLFQAQHLITAGLGRPGELGERVRASNQNELVEMVLAGAADAAFIRTGVIEGLMAKGKLAEGDLRVLEDKAAKPDDLHRTTRWYPEWSLVARPARPTQEVQDIAAFLKGLEPNNPALAAAAIVGFVNPLDISQVVRAMQSVGVAPYAMN